MRIKPTIPIPRIILSIVVMQLVAGAFVYFKEAFIFSGATLLWLPALCFLAYQFVRSPQTPPYGQTPTIPWPRFALNITLLFGFILLIAWQFNYLSLFQTQPVMFDAEGTPIMYDVKAYDLLAFTVRMVWQTWLLAMCLAWAFHLLPQNKSYGFLRAFYRRPSLIAWFTSNMTGAGVIVALYFILALFSIDIAKFIAKSAGADVINVPQFQIIVFLMMLYMMNLATAFTKRLRAYAEQPSTRTVFVILAQVSFFILCYGLTYVFMAWLPEETMLALMEPFYFEFIDPARFPYYWQLFATTIALLLTPLLASHFYRMATCQAFKQSYALMLAVPFVLTVGLVLLFPHMWQDFMQWVPALDFSVLRLDNTTSRYHIAWAGFISILAGLLFIKCVYGNQQVIASMTDILPKQVGGRERRLKALIGRSTAAFFMIGIIYLLMGAFSSLVFISTGILAILAGLTVNAVTALNPRRVLT